MGRRDQKDMKEGKLWLVCKRKEKFNLKNCWQLVRWLRELGVLPEKPGLVSSTPG